MVVHPSGIDLSSRTLRHLSGLLAGNRRRIRSRWRRLTCGRQALLVLAHLRPLCRGLPRRDRHYRYIHDAVDLLAALAPTLTEAMQSIRTKTFVILDDTLLSIDRIAADTPHYSGKHKRHGMNVQVLTDSFGRLVWASPALAGSVHDLTAARTHRIIRICERQGIPILADRAYTGADPWITTGRRRPPCGQLTPTERTVNRALATSRAPVERGMARLKSSRIYRRSRCSPNRMTSIAKAVLTLERQS
ncbi:MULTISPECIES: transposase family protein [unclassified Streptomyces]|uniref:transposase family protein n=1 Tax=unclassified Streptomyces TaxID=2593676 RepID=UPI0036AF18EE